MHKNEKDTNQAGDDFASEEISRVKIYIMDTAIMLLLLFFDQLTKYLAILHLKKQPSIVLIDGVLELQYLENRGSAFSLFEGQKALILIMGFIFLAAVLFFLHKLPANKKFCITHVLTAVLIAGALGNIIDRIRYDFVVDFISFVLIHFPVFNVADCYIVISAIVLFFLFMFFYKEEDLKWIGSALK